ncbi:hypothetical protein [Bradyrhizobium quebecense]|uniref:Uncharacterized protein n=1 Tax=Bradyrhizobium quebecense TaxID=2748629 RepID=A0A973WLI7_9BRAD
MAREAADIVLLDDSFPSITAASGLGVGSSPNLRKALIFITATHIPIPGRELLPILLKSLISIMSPTGFLGYAGVAGDRAGTSKRKSAHSAVVGMRIPP